MSKHLKKVVFVCSILCYLLSLFAFFHIDSQVLFLYMDSGFFLAASVLSAVFLLLFAYLSFAQDRRAADGADSHIASIKTEWNIETQELKKQLSVKEEALTALREELTSTEKKNAELAAQVQELKELSAYIPGKSSIFPEYAQTEIDVSVLPQSLPKRSESTYVNIVEIAKSVASEFHDIAMQAGLTIQISADNENLLIKSDLNMLRILFRNIVDNSVKYMLERGSLIITISSIGDDIFIVCKDTGKGLVPAETAHIFELNYQGSNRISGNGLGLYQAQAIVSFYGGTIFAKSNLGDGMGIYIQLPAK